MLLLIDNYDSFTFNLVHYIGELGTECLVKRNDALNVQDAMGLRPDGILLSPGPCDPDKAGICLALTEAAAEAGIPLLGVCLGHQVIAQAMGGDIIRAPVPMHGKVSEIHHRGTDLFENIPDPFPATRYHSLTVARETLPDCLNVTAASDDGLIMVIAHKELPLYGVQFHPESLLTTAGHQILNNFLKQ